MCQAGSHRPAASPTCALKRLHLQTRSQNEPAPAVMGQVLNGAAGSILSSLPCCRRCCGGGEGRGRRGGRGGGWKIPI
eukprot:1157510-Pelagomonas_calceolata.AAC.3